MAATQTGFTPLLAALAVATTLASAGPAMAGLSARVETAPVSDVGAMTSSQAAAEPQSIDEVTRRRSGREGVAPVARRSPKRRRRAEIPRRG